VIDTTFVFIVGTGRCGSTLIHEVLARHPDIGFVSNIEANLPLLALKGRWNNLLYRVAPRPFSGRTTAGGKPTARVSRLAWLAGERFGLRVAPSEAYRILNRDVSPTISGTNRDLTEADAQGSVGDRFRRFFLERARAQRKPVFLHKFTGWPRTRFIHALIPDVRLIHVVRDGRAVAASLLRMPWWRGRQGPPLWGEPLPEADARDWEASGRSLALLAGLEWKLLMDAFETAKSQVSPEQWREIRYEDFVEDPRRHAADLLAWLGLGWNHTFEAGFSRYSFRLAPTEAWRRDLSQRDIELLERSLAGHLAHYGYPLD
jgi:hypothetical protein